MTQNSKFAAASTALIIVDLQNDFLSPQGAYARGKTVSADALPKGSQWCHRTF
jgi:nicotinamidase-related amidase